MKNAYQIRHKLIVIAIFTMACGVTFWITQPLIYNPLKISVIVKSAQDEICQIFYDEGKGFSGNLSMKKRYNPEMGYTRLEFTLPRTMIRHLRIDPGVRSEEYMIKRIILQAGGVTKKYSGNSIQENFYLQNLQFSYEVSDNVVKLFAGENPDVQMIFRDQIVNSFPLINYTLKKYIPVIFILIYASGVLLFILAGYRIFRFSMKEFSEARSYFGTYFSAGNIRLLVDQNRYIIIFSFLLAVVAFGYELFNFTLSPDEEINSFNKATESSVYLIVGRWGIYYLNHLVSPESVLPYFPFLISLVCLATSAILFITKFKLKFYAMLVFSIVFITHPIHSYYLGFNTSNMYYGFGMVLSVLGVLAFSAVISNKGPKNILILLSVIFLMLAISFYQSLLAFYLVTGIFLIFYQQHQYPIISTRKTIFSILILVAISVVAVIFYQLINMASRYLVLGSISGPSYEYVENLIAWGKKPIPEIIRSLYAGLMNYFTNGNFYGGISAQTVIVIIPMIVFYILKKTMPLKNKLTSILLLILLFFAPFTIVFLSGMPLPVRTLMAFPLMLGIIWAFTHDQSAKWFRSFMLIFAIYILINNTYTNTRLFYASKVSWEADRNMAVRISTRIYDLDLPDYDGRIPVAFAGSYQHPSNLLFLRSDIHGTSFFKWDEGATYRLEPFFKILGINDFKMIDFSHFEHLAPSVDEMPSWPARGSVKLIEDIVIVKLSDESDNDK